MRTAIGHIVFSLMNSIELGHVLKARRRLLRIDQQALAEIAGVSVHALSDIESGKGNPTWSVINRLAAVLGLAVSLQVASTGPGLGDDPGVAP